MKPAPSISFALALVASSAVFVGACATGEALPMAPGSGDAAPSSIDAGRSAHATEGGTAPAPVGDGGAPLARPRPPTSGEVIFVELMANPKSPVTDEGGEWIELLNVSDASLELEGCVLDDNGIESNQHTIGTSVVLAPGELAVMAKKSNASDNGGLQTVATAFDNEFSLANGGGTISLECDGESVDVVEFDPSWPYSEGVSMQLATSKQTAVRNDSKAAWCAAENIYANGQRGSPGETTDHCP